MNRPEYVKCVLTGFADENKTCCGRIPDFAEWCFTEPTHAFLNARQGGRLITCSGCVDEICKTLQEDQEL